MGGKEQCVKMISKLRGGVHSFVSLSRCGLQVLVQRGKRERGREIERGEKSGRRISMASPSSEFQLGNPISVTRSQTRSRRCASAVQRLGERGKKKGKKE